MEKIVFVGSSWVFAKYSYLACQILGYKPVFMGDLNFYSEEIQESIKKCEYYDVDINSVDDMHQLIIDKGIDNIAGITTSADSKLKNAILLGKKLGNTKYPDEHILGVTDKYEVVKLIPEYSPISLTFHKEKIPYKQILDLLAQQKTLFLKPRHGSGGTGIKTINNSQDVNELSSYLGQFKEDTWLVQQVIQGELYSLEGYCVDGQIKVLGFSTRDRIGATEMTNHFPVALQKEVSDDSFKALCLLIERSGFRYGHFHAEFLSDGEQVYLIDANFGRMAGGAFIEQISVAMQKRPEEIVAHIISVGLFSKEREDFSLSQKDLSKTVAISFGLEESAHYLQVIKPKRLDSNYYTSIANENSFVEAVGKNDYSWIGIIVGKEKSVLKDIQQIKIKTTTGIKSAKYFLRSDLSGLVIGKEENSKSNFTVTEIRIVPGDLKIQRSNC